MKNLIFFALLLGILNVGCTQKVVPGSADVDDDILINELLVVLEQGYNRTTIEGAFREYKVKLNQKSKKDGEITWIASFDEDTIRADKLLVKMVNHPGVKEANFVEVTEAN